MGSTSSSQKKAANPKPTKSETKPKAMKSEMIQNPKLTKHDMMRHLKDMYPDSEYGSANWKWKQDLPEQQIRKIYDWSLVYKPMQDKVTKHIYCRLNDDAEGNSIKLLQCNKDVKMLREIECTKLAPLLGMSQKSLFKTLGYDCDDIFKMSLVASSSEVQFNVGDKCQALCHKNANSPLKYYDAVVVWISGELYGIDYGIDGHKIAKLPRSELMLTDDKLVKMTRKKLGMQAYSDSEKPRVGELDHGIEVANAGEPGRDPARVPPESGSRFPTKHNGPGWDYARSEGDGVFQEHPAKSVRRLVGADPSAPALTVGLAAGSLLLLGAYLAYAFKRRFCAKRVPTTSEIDLESGELHEDHG